MFLFVVLMTVMLLLELADRDVLIEGCLLDSWINLKVN